MQFFSVVSFNQHTRNMACLMLQVQMSNGLNESGSYKSTNGAARQLPFGRDLKRMKAAVPVGIPTAARPATSTRL
jgi:hypothetical protein